MKPLTPKDIWPELNGGVPPLRDLFPELGPNVERGPDEPTPEEVWVESMAVVEHAIAMAPNPYRDLVPETTFDAATGQYPPRESVSNLPAFKNRHR